MRAVTPPISREPSHDGDLHRHASNHYDGGHPRQNDQYGDGYMNSRYSRQNQVDDDYLYLRPVPVHPSYDADPHPDDAANNHYIKTYMPPSLDGNRRSGKYDGDPHRQPGDALPPPTSLRHAQSWDREADGRSSSVNAKRPMHPERSAVVEMGNQHTGTSSNRELHRPDPQHLPSSSDDYLTRESTSEHWHLGATGEDRRDDRLQPPRAANLPPRPAAPRSGGSLLDRLSSDKSGASSGPPPSQSLRDRVQVPSKRDRDDTIRPDSMGDAEMGDSVSKRSKKRMKPKRGRRNVIQ